MAFTIEPIVFVSAPRTTPEDDDWGGHVVEIRLAPGMDASSIHGLDTFSHVEVPFVLHEVDTAKVVTGARHPRNHPA